MTPAPSVEDPARAPLRAPRDPAAVKRYNERYYARKRLEILEKARQKYAQTKHLRPRPPSDRETTLYRFYDAHGVLVYVGITYNFPVRLTQHRRRSEWFETVDHWTTETHPTRRAAKNVETQSIREEMPRFNRHESTS